MGAVLALIAVVFFAVAAFGGSIVDNDVALGLAFLAAAHVVGSWVPSGWPLRRGE
jgi:hypothetical protein